MKSAVIGSRGARRVAARIGAVLGMALGLASVCTVASANADGPGPVLMVISNQDFWYQDYADTRASLEAQGLEVVVAATTTEVSLPRNASHGGFVVPDVALTDVAAEDYSAIVFSGGWGMAQYQYGFEGTYHDSAHRADRRVAAMVNRLIGDMLAADRPVTAVANGVSVLAWARVDGMSPLQGRVVVGSARLSPPFDLKGEALSVPTRWHVEANGGVMLHSGASGDPTTSTDDVIVDGRIITAENYDSAQLFGATLARALRD